MFGRVATEMRLEQSQGIIWGLGTEACIEFFLVVLLPYSYPKVLVSFGCFFFIIPCFCVLVVKGRQLSVSLRYRPDPLSVLQRR